MLRVLVTGDRHWTDRGILEAVLHDVLVWGGPFVVIEGEADGADSMARRWAERNDCPVDPYPARWTPTKHTPVHRIRYRKDGSPFDYLAGPLRNQRMLDEGQPHLVLAFHKDLRESSGTRDMVRIAEKAGLPVYVFPEDTRPGAAQMTFDTVTLEDRVRALRREHVSPC